MKLSHVLSTVSMKIIVLLAGILQCVQIPGSVYSIMSQWWHLMLLQYVAAIFHLPSVSTAIINTVQYKKPYQQYGIPTILAVVISKVLLPQSDIMTSFVHSHSNFFCDFSPVLPKYSNLNVTQFTVKCSNIISCSPDHTCPNSPTVNTQQYNLTLYTSPQSCDNIIQLNNKLWMLNCSTIKCKIHIESCSLPWFALLIRVERIDEGMKICIVSHLSALKLRINS